MCIGLSGLVLTFNASLLEATGDALAVRRTALSTQLLGPFAPSGMGAELMSTMVGVHVSSICVFRAVPD